MLKKGNWTMSATTLSSKAIEALKALKALQENAKRKGLDKMTMEEIDAEIAAYHREKRQKENGPKQSGF